MRLLRRKPKPQPLRRGLLEKTVEVPSRGVTWDVVFEVSEWERAGDLSRITVNNVSGVPAHAWSMTKSLLPNWVTTDSVTWLP